MEDRIVQTHSLKQIIDMMFPDKLNTKSLSAVMTSLKKHRKVSLKEIADLILFVADTSHRNWNIEMILTCINDSLENINWRGVFELFLESDLKIWNTEYLYTIVDSWVHISGIITVPYEIFFRKWDNRDNQIEFLRILLESDEKRTQVYSNIFFEKLVTKEDLENSKCKRSIEYESNFNSVELFKCLKEIDGVEIMELIRERSPEYCLLGLAAVQPFQETIFDELIVSFSEGVTSQFIYYLLFLRYRSSILHSFARVCNTISLTRILDILLEHKMLPIITEVPEPVDFCYDIIILSSRRDHLNLEIWFSNNLKKHSVSFIKYLGNKLIVNADKDLNSNLNTFIKADSLKPDSEIFPFNRTIVNTVIKILDSNAKDLSEESLNIVREIKSKLLDFKSFEKPNHSDRATDFLADLMSSRIEIDESISKLNELIRGDEHSINFAKRIFALLIINYSSLYKLQNSDTMAVFFGELIKQKLLFKPILKMALHQIKNSLRFPESDREYAFAFRILEVFFAELPEFFFEIEDIESVKYGLIKKELIIVDEDTQREIDLDDLLNIVFTKDDDISGVDDYIEKGIINAIDNLKISSSCSVNYYISFDDSILSSTGTTTAGQVCKYIYKHLDSKKINGYFNYCFLQKDSFKDLVIEKGFSLLKLFFTYKIQDELAYCATLGSFLGSLLIGQNKPVILDIFDFRSFILKSIEYRRISITVYFVTNFLKEGKNSLIFVPKNPWLMSMLDLLSELYSCTLINVRQKISELFTHFNLKLIHKPSKRMKTHLVKYSIDYEGVLRQVISLALDFSVREICNKIVKMCFSVAKNTAIALFDKLYGENRFFLFRNLLVNLTRSYIHISAQEPLKASMCGNITHFLKLGMNELPLESVYTIVTNNLFICCSIIEKAGITQANEVVSSLFNQLLANEKNQLSNIATLDPKNSLKVLSESCFVEKTNIRSIENIEYQEIRNFLIAIGRKMPAKKRDFISEEWPSLLEPERVNNFRKLLITISQSSEKDEMCLSLCKYLVGHALKTECSEEFVFEFIESIFELSAKCKREVVGWLIYSEDPKRFNLQLIKKFIEFDFICLEELDQSLKKLLETEEQRILSFTLDLLSLLMFQEIKYCTVYDFIYTIEALNRMNENPRVFEFFKKIESGMMRFQDTLPEQDAFEDFLKNFKYEISPEQYLPLFKEKYKMENLNFSSAFKISWHHFVLFSGSFRFFKIDVLAAIVREDLYLYLKESLKYLVQAYSKSHYLFFMFYCRFFVKILDIVENTIENRILIWKILELFSPSNLPSFITQYIEILNHPFCVKYLDRNEGFFVAKELLESLKLNPKLEPIVTDFFTRNIEFFRKFSIYLSYICPEEFVNIKNIFNQSRPKALEKCSNSFFNSFYMLSKHTRPYCAYNDLIDHLCELNPITSFALENLKVLVDKKVAIKEIVCTLMIRTAARLPPPGIKSAFEEITKKTEIKEVVAEYGKKIFNKLSN